MLSSAINEEWQSYFKIRQIRLKDKKTRANRLYNSGTELNETAMFCPRLSCNRRKIEKLLSGLGIFLWVGAAGVLFSFVQDVAMLLLC